MALERVSGDRPPPGPGAANPQVQLAGRSDDAFERMSDRTTHADVLTKRAVGLRLSRASAKPSAMQREAA